MGVDISSILIRHEKSLGDFKGKSIALDAYNMLYQFLASIRQPDGTPLKDFKGNITSHLSGLFYRTVNLVKVGITPIYVFDGQPPEFKRKEIEERKQRKEEALFMVEKAETLELEEIKRYAQATSKLTHEMVEESKELLRAMGVSVVQAPSEGEAQASYLAKKGIVYASASQDYDSLLFGSPRLIRNLSIVGRRKLPRRNEYVIVHPEEIVLEENLNKLNITREQLILIGIMVGTDFNKGVKGIGPKKALKRVTKYSIEENLKFIEQNDLSCENVEEIFNFFKHPPVSDEKIVEENLNKENVLKILVEQHDFNQERVERTIHELLEAKQRSRQKTLVNWFK